MDLEKRLKAFISLGLKIKSLSYEEIEELSDGAQANNPWFNKDSVRYALKGMENYLDKKRLSLWIESYNLSAAANIKIGVIMAGNIPFAGFHDFLCVLISGYKLKAKLSSQDEYLPRKITEYLVAIEPGFKEYIEFIDLLKDAEAVIATGSSNSSRYFNYYFSKKPHIIRKSRNSCAVLTGEETDEEIDLLGNDIFTYYGLGCRSISKLYVPSDYDLPGLLNRLESFSYTIQHHKYSNNYDYNKSIYLINKEPHLDNGFLILKQDPGMASPISVVYFEKYNDKKELVIRLEAIKDNIQCIVSSESWFPGSVDFGRAQTPELWEYADGVDTMRFLQSLKY
ncbi:MAG TPA: acyl-CoA reductase [Cytophagales bacterium]|nr:acyl-CoA reductase [Cytophagales bacterium]